MLTKVVTAAKLESRVSINESIDRQLELTLRQFVTFKTVSSDRNLREQCYCGAKYLCKILVEVLGMCLNPKFSVLLCEEAYLHAWLLQPVQLEVMWTNHKSTL